MLQIEAAAFASVSRKALAGRIRLGIPDDYAESFLPADPDAVHLPASARGALRHLRELFGARRARGGP